MVTFGRGSDDDSSTSDPGGGTDPAPSTGGGDPDDGAGTGTGSINRGGGTRSDDPDPTAASTTVEQTFGPGPTTAGGLGEPEPAATAGRDMSVTTEVATAEANDDIVDRATTGGLLSERGESAGLLPDEVSANTPRGEVSVDVSETRARNAARDAAGFGDDIDLGAAFSSPASPLAAGGSGANRDIVATDADPQGAFAELQGDPAGENPVENFVEGGTQAATNLPGGLLQTETAAEVAQSSPGVAQDFERSEIAETTVAQGRDAAAETATQAAQNPAEFAGATAASAALGAGAASRGSTGSLGTAVRAELDPRVGPFGTTAPTRAARGAREFLRDDRGQADFAGLSRSRDTDSGSGGLDDDLQDALDTFESQGGTDLPGDPDRLDPRGAEFDQEPDIDAADPVQARRQQAQEIDASADSTTGALGLDERPTGGTRVDALPDRDTGAATPDVAPVQDVFDTSVFTRVDADGTSPGSAAGSGVSPVTGASVGGLLGTPGDDGPPATGTDAGGLLGTPGAVDSTGATADAGGDLFGGGLFGGGRGADSGPQITPDTRTDVPSDTRTDAPADTRTDVPSDTRTDSPTDTRTDSPSDSRDPSTRDPRDPGTRDPRDPGRDREPRDPEQPFEAAVGDGDDDAPLFGTAADDALVDSGILGADAAIEAFLRR